jgi:hypothetical protein
MGELEETPSPEAMEDFQTRLHGYLRFNDINPSLHILDQIAQLPKDILFRLSYESIVGEMPKTASWSRRRVASQTTLSPSAAARPVEPTISGARTGPRGR